MTDQEFDAYNKRLKDYRRLRSILERAKALETQISESDDIPFSVGCGYAKHDLSEFDSDLRNQLQESLRRICTEQISRLEKQMEEL